MRPDGTVLAGFVKFCPYRNSYTPRLAGADTALPLQTLLGLDSPTELGERSIIREEFNHGHQENRHEEDFVEEES
jgi:hypothetical protein